jgi:hypothetical protein
VFESSDEDELAQLRREKEVFRKEETIKIIFEYFHFWEPLEIYKEDLTKEESENLKNFTKEEKELIFKKIRKGKLEKIRNEIESAEIKEICQNFEQKELYRKNFLELVELLLSEIEK